jgi:hypothetical protein
MPSSAHCRASTPSGGWRFLRLIAHRSVTALPLAAASSIAARRWGRGKRSDPPHAQRGVWWNFHHRGRRGHRVGRFPRGGAETRRSLTVLPSSPSGTLKPSDAPHAQRRRVLVVRPPALSPLRKQGSRGRRRVVPWMPTFAGMTSKGRAYSPSGGDQTERCTPCQAAHPAARDVRVPVARLRMRSKKVTIKVIPNVSGPKLDGRHRGVCAGGACKAWQTGPRGGG